jgi:hypothetical protein
MAISVRRVMFVAAAAALLVGLTPTGAASEPLAVPDPTIEGPIPGSVPGDPLSPVLEDTYPFFSTWYDLEGAGYVEQEFYISGNADAYSTTGALVGSDVPYKSRLIVRRPTNPARFNGTVLVEWQNVTAGYDLDALWSVHAMRAGYAWIGVWRSGSASTSSRPGAPRATAISMSPAVASS